MLFFILTGFGAAHAAKYRTRAGWRSALPPLVIFVHMLFFILTLSVQRVLLGACDPTF